MAEPGLTQAISVSAMGLVMLAVDLVVIAPMVDLFVDLGSTTLPVGNIVMKECMTSILVYGTWFYTIIFIMAWLLVAYPIIYIIKRHRYIDVEEIGQSEEMYMGGN